MLVCFIFEFDPLLHEILQFVIFRNFVLFMPIVNFLDGHNFENICNFQKNGFVYAIWVYYKAMSKILAWFVKNSFSYSKTTSKVQRVMNKIMNCVKSAVQFPVEWCFACIFTTIWNLEKRFSKLESWCEYWPGQILNLGLRPINFKLWKLENMSFALL
jgi:hypothetical protein